VRGRRDVATRPVVSAVEEGRGHLLEKARGEQEPGAALTDTADAGSREGLAIWEP